MSVNKCILIGRLGNDPEIKTTQGGATVATFSLATSEKFTDKAGERQEKTEWHRIVLWNKLAELAQRYLAKGRQVYIEGKLTTRSWDDAQTGQKKYMTEIVGFNMTFLDKGDGGGAGNQGAPAGQRSGGGQGGGGQQRSSQGGGGYGGGSKPAPAPKPAAPAGFEGHFDDDDIPF